MFKRYFITYLKYSFTKLSKTGYKIIKIIHRHKKPIQDACTVSLSDMNEPIL